MVFFMAGIKRATNFALFHRHSIHSFRWTTPIFVSLL
jgi:hypothetical protein